MKPSRGRAGGARKRIEKGCQLVKQEGFFLQPDALSAARETQKERSKTKEERIKQRKPELIPNQKTEDAQAYKNVFDPPNETWGRHFGR